MKKVNLYIFILIWITNNIFREYKIFSRKILILKLFLRDIKWYFLLINLSFCMVVEYLLFQEENLQWIV
jgi:hypothetical protein